MKNKAFTLIELLVVVLIIGILAAIAVPQYQKAVLKSQFTQLKLLVSALIKAQEEYYLVHGDYASDINSLAITIPIDDSKYTCHLSNKRGAGCDGRIMYYQIFNTDDVYVPGRRECGVLDNTNKNAVAICQEETGKTEPDWTSGKYSSYKYNY